MTKFLILNLKNLSLPIVIIVNSNAALVTSESWLAVLYQDQKNECSSFTHPCSSASACLHPLSHKPVSSQGQVERKLLQPWREAGTPPTLTRTRCGRPRARPPHAHALRRPYELPSPEAHARCGRPVSALRQRALCQSGPSAPPSGTAEEFCNAPEPAVSKRCPQNNPQRQMPSLCFSFFVLTWYVS